VSCRPKGLARPRHEAGYALLMAVFMVATIIVLVAAISPSVLIQGRREREQDAVWRANQYVRAVRLYYQKNGRFPQTLEDLTKASPSGAHYLRKVYTDPTNREDGTWRMIYVSPSGQLIGSVHYHSLQEMAAAQGFGAAATSGSSASGTAQQTGQQSTGQQSSSFGSSFSQQSSSFGQQSSPGGQQQSPGGQQPSSGFGSSSQPAPLAPLEAVDGPVLGGSVIGVGGKTKVPSLLVVDGAKTYFQWEFIYNPLASVGGQLPGATSPAAVAGAAAGAAGQAGATAPPGTAANPQSGNPGQTPVAPAAPPPAIQPPGTDTTQPNPAQ
jgi:hypothetical protein